MFTLSRRSASAAARFLTGRIPPAPFRRRFGAAAAVELAGDSEWDDDDRFSSPIAAVDTWGRMKERGVQWVFMGSPSSQKRDYATRIARLLEVPYISMGTLVRQELHPHSSIYVKIANAVNEGKLVTEEVIFGLLSKRLEEGYYRGESGFILDGIPRTRVQAEILDQIADIDLVVNLKSSEDCLVKNHIGNDICARCGKIYDCFNSQSTPLNPCLATSTNHCKVDTSATFEMDKSRLEKLQIYSEQGPSFRPPARLGRTGITTSSRCGPRTTYTRPGERIQGIWFTEDSNEVRGVPSPRSSPTAPTPWG